MFPIISKLTKRTLGENIVINHKIIKNKIDKELKISPPLAPPPKKKTENKGNKKTTNIEREQPYYE